MGFDPANYQARISLAGGDFRTCFSSESVTTPGHWHREAQALGLIAKAATAFLDSGATILVTPTDAESERTRSANEDRPAETSDPASDPHGPAAIAGGLRETLNARAPSDDAAPFALLGAIGPVDPLLTLSEIEASELEALFAAQARSLARGGVDAIICRGFTELESLAVAVRSVRHATSLPVIASMVFDSGPDYSQTPMAVTIPQAGQKMLEAGAAMIGCDGSEFPDGAPAVVSLIRASCSLPVYVEISAGRAELTETGIRYPEPPKAFGERLERLIDAGAAIVAGGAGVSPAHMAELSRAAARFKKRHRPGRS